MLKGEIRATSNCRLFWKPGLQDSLPAILGAQATPVMDESDGCICPCGVSMELSLTNGNPFSLRQHLIFSGHHSQRRSRHTESGWLWGGSGFCSTQEDSRIVSGICCCRSVFSIRKAYHQHSKGRNKEHGLRAKRPVRSVRRFWPRAFQTMTGHTWVWAAATTELDGGPAATHPYWGKEGWLWLGSLSAWTHLEWLLSEQDSQGEEGQAGSVSEDRGSGVTHRLCHVLSFGAACH